MLSAQEFGMKEPAENKEIEERITMEIIVDAYGPEEQALGWYYYLENNLHVPFRARCIATRTISPYKSARRSRSWACLPKRNVRTTCSCSSTGKVVRLACPSRNW